MNVTETGLPGARVIQTDRYRDERGWFSELWNLERYRRAGIDVALVQENVSRSTRGVLRGMHYQHPHGQAKLVSVLHGAVFDVIVDIRRGSPTFGRWFGIELSAENATQLFLPVGMAHGFLVLSDDALVHYGCSAVFRSEYDRAIAWNDEDIGIAWPAAPAVVSAKDDSAPALRALEIEALPVWED
jgi:dTDP-4-dehydrorhamnose 3,5-epimerase